MKLYTSIDEMPAYNWLKCVENQQYEWCAVKRPTGHLSNAHMNECKGAFGLLYEQYIDRYGISEHLQEILSLQNQIMIHNIDLAIDGDRSIKMHIKIKEMELAKLIEAAPVKTNSVKIAIEKYLNRHLDMRIITMVEYYDYIEELKVNKAA